MFGIRFMKPFLIGQNNQVVRFHQIAHQRAQRVVIPKLNLFGHHRIVLVHHGNNPELKH